MALQELDSNAGPRAEKAMRERLVAVLCARADSHYKTIPYLDVFDAARDARTFKGGMPAIAHPPCRSWGRLKAFAKPAPGERLLAHFCVAQVRKYGGVLEHPAWSSLWPAADMPGPGEVDEFGGWTLPIVQFWWGHPAEKATWLYIVGVAPSEVPAIPFCLGEPLQVVSSSLRGTRRRVSVSREWREMTPPAMAEWLVDLARRCA